MDRTTAINKVKEYADLVKSRYAVDKIILFGSYAKNNFSEYSDIDVAVIFNSYSGDFLDLSADLYKLTRNIDYRIEPVLLDMENDKSGFIQDILKNGFVIYDRKEHPINVRL